MLKARISEPCQPIKFSMSRGRTLKFITSVQEVVILNLQRSKTEREFKSLDGASAVARRIGFDWLNVQIGDLQWREKVY